jgi:hypothetical protein
MLLFIDTATLAMPARASKAVVGRALVGLADAVGPHLAAVELVFMGGADAGAAVAAIAKSVTQVADRVVGCLADHPPPTPLGCYERIRYRLFLQSPVRIPTWLAILPDAASWPEDQAGRLILCPEPVASAVSQTAIRTRLAQYYWAELWWGSGPPPDKVRRAQAHGLMVAWSVPRKRWPELLGSTAADFESRLGLLLAIHAGAQLVPARRTRYDHWVHLPSAGLDMRRPLEVMTGDGVRGIRRVHDYIWLNGTAGP